MGVLRTIENFVFGMDCLGCGKSSDALDPWLCPDCERRLRRESLGMSFPAPDVFCLYPMDSLTRRLIHSLKYKSIPGMARFRRSRQVSSRPYCLVQLIFVWLESDA